MKLGKFSLVRSRMNSFHLVAIFVLLALPWGSNLYKKPFIEDAWYGLSIARNISNGFGITIDRSQITNGFQPMQVFIDSVFYYISNSEHSAILLSFLFRISLHICSAFVFVILSKQFDADSEKYYLDIFSFSIYLFNPAIITCAINGLETGLLLFLFLVLMLSLVKHISLEADKSTPLHFLLCAIALIYTRIDTVILISCLLVWYFLFYSKKIAIRMLIGIYLAVTPWLIWNFMNFDSIIPISGLQQQQPSISIFRAAHLLKAISYNSSPWLGSNYDQKSFALEILFFSLRIGFFLWILFFLIAKRDFFHFNRIKSKDFGLIAAVVIGLFITSCYYGIMTFATYFYQRYTILFAPLVLLLLLRNIRDTSATKIRIVMSILVISLLQFLMYYHSSKSENVLYRDQVHLVLNSVPKNQIVGARQSGTLGYFRDNVLNLDGKVNPKAPKSEIEMNRYLRSERVDWLCDWPSELKKIVGIYKDDWQIFSRNSSVVCLKRKFIQTSN